MSPTWLALIPALLDITDRLVKMAAEQRANGGQLTPEFIAAQEQYAETKLQVARALDAMRDDGN